MNAHAKETAETIRSAVLEAGYDACGIATADAFPEFERILRERMDRFPETRALYEPMLKRGAPQAAAPWAHSLIVAVRRYGKYRLPPGLAGHIGRAYLFDRRTAACPDHAMAGEVVRRLKALGLRVRKGGVPDRWAAARAGIARFGRNGFVYAEKGGSWINVETWLTDARLPADAPALDVPCPPDCRACAEACPTGALDGPFSMRMDRCVAYLTFAAPEPIAEELQKQMGGWMYGCDRCQEVCPRNRGQWKERDRADWLEAVATLLTPAALAEMDDETYRNAVHPLFWYIPADRADRWRANARRARRNRRSAPCESTGSGGETCYFDAAMRE